MVVIRLIVLMLVLLMGAVVSAAPTTLTFSEVSVPNQTELAGTTYFDSYGVSFDGGTVYVENANFNEDGKGVYNGLNGGSDIVMMWDTPVTSVSFNYVLLGTFAGGLDIYAKAYDAADNLIDDFDFSYDPKVTPIPVYGTGAVDGGLIKKVVWHDGSDIVGIDSVTYNPIPAPGAFLLGTLGTGLVGWFRKRS